MKSNPSLTPGFSRVSVRVEYHSAVSTAFPCCDAKPLKRLGSLEFVHTGLNLMPFGNSPRKEAPTGDLRNRPASNPKGIVSSSPGLRGTSYPGAGAEGYSTPTGLRPSCPDAPQPRWGCGLEARFPKVARASQPWALCRNPVGIQHWNSRKKLGLKPGANERKTLEHRIEAAS